jgi:hypothetical protein
MDKDRWRNGPKKGFMILKWRQKDEEEAFREAKALWPSGKGDCHPGGRIVGELIGSVIRVEQNGDQRFTKNCFSFPPRPKKLFSTPSPTNGCLRKKFAANCEYLRMNRSEQSRGSVWSKG